MEPILELVDTVKQARTELLDAVAGWSTEQGAFKPCADEWSASQIVEHVYNSEFRVINTLWKGIDGLKTNRPIWCGEPVNRGARVEALVAKLAGGKFKSPEAVEPKVGGPLLFWCSALDACQLPLSRLGSALQDVDQEAIFYPHFLLGPLDANQWFQFVGRHLHRHRRQIERLRACEDFPV